MLEHHPLLSETMMWNFSKCMRLIIVNLVPPLLAQSRWQHDHQVIHRDAAVKLSPGLSTLPHSQSKKTCTHTSRLLPPLEPHILAGHTPRLMVSSFITVAQL